MNLSKNTQLQRAMDAVAAGTGDSVNGDIIDAQNANGGLDFSLHLGAITATAVTTAKIQHGSVADGSDMADITGASVSIPDTADGKLVEIEIAEPIKRYHRIVVTRATANAVINGAQVRLHGTRVTPRDLHSSVYASSVVAPV